MIITPILIAAFAAFVVGFLIHGPLFGKLWMRLAHIHPTGKEKFKDMLPQMAWNLLSNIVMASVLCGVFILIFSSRLMGEPTAFRGALCAAWLWLGFIVTSSSMDVIWLGRSKKYWLFESLTSLAMLMTMGAVLGSSIFGSW